jgi:hypothetical protein
MASARARLGAARRSTIRSTDEGVVEYIRYHGILYKKVFDKA